MREPAGCSYDFGSFHLEPDERLLTHEGQPVPLTPKAFDTLVMLVERAGRLVEKEELIKRLWPESFVEEANLNQHVWTLRKALGEIEQGSIFIATVPKKGFRFVAPVTKSMSVATETVTSPSEANSITADLPLQVGAGKSWSSRKLPVVVLTVVILGLSAYGLWRKRAERAITPPKSIAVLPFKPVSPESRDESLEMGMAETLITRLSNLNQIVVRPMSAVRKYTDLQQDPVKAGRELEVEAVLDGSIQKVGEHLRVTVRLTAVPSGASLWAQEFDENFTNLFEVQDSISQRVANMLPRRLNGEEQGRLTKRYTVSPEAYQLYLQAQYLWDNRNDENRRKMFQYYEQAISRDPNFALAYVGLADLQITMVGDNAVAFSEVRPKIMANLTKALELDPNLAQARNLLAEVKYQFDFDWTEAEKEFRKAIELNPNVASIHLAYGWYLMMLGRFSEADREMERAQELDPHSLVINRARGRLLYFMGRYDEAIQHFQRILNEEPNIGLNHTVLADVYERKGMYAEAVEEYSKTSLIADTRPGRVDAAKEIFRVSGWHAYLQSRKDLMLSPGAGYLSPISLANINARLGNNDEAFIWLEKAIDARASGIPGLKVDPVFRNLHSDPRFPKLLRRMNLTM